MARRYRNQRGGSSRTRPFFHFAAGAAQAEARQKGQTCEEYKAELAAAMAAKKNS